MNIRNIYIKVSKQFRDSTNYGRDTNFAGGRRCEGFAEHMNFVRIPREKNKKFK